MFDYRLFFASTGRESARRVLGTGDPARSPARRRFVRLPDEHRARPGDRRR